jgi:hypothetical protein
MMLALLSYDEWLHICQSSLTKLGFFFVRYVKSDQMIYHLTGGHTGHERERERSTMCRITAVTYLILISFYATEGYC